MSDELKIGVVISFNKGGAKASRVENIDVDITGDAFNHDIQSVGITEGELAQSADLGTPGFVFLKNLDSTNYIQVGSTTGVYDIKLKAGEIALYRHGSATIYAKANMAACLVEYLIFED